MDHLNIRIITFNCARELIKPEVFANHINTVSLKSPLPDLVIVSLQEVAPIAYAFLGGSMLVPYFDRVRHTVHLVASNWGNAKYINSITRNVGMTAIMAFVREDHFDRIEWIETAGVGVGLQEMGNKGAVGLKLAYSTEATPVEMTFVAAHLAPMEHAVERRNEDWKNIVKRLIFTPVNERAVQRAMRPRSNHNEDAPLLPGSPDNESRPTSGLYTPASYLFFAGDLNYRTSCVKPSTRDYQAYPQLKDDPVGSVHYKGLLNEDQLSKEMKAQRTCHGLREASINFPPTYKYSQERRAVADSLTDSNTETSFGWAKHRWPSWCDRILYLDMPLSVKSAETQIVISIHDYTALPLMSSSDHQPVSLMLSVPLRPVPFSKDNRNPEPTHRLPVEPTLPELKLDGLDVRWKPPFELDSHWRERRRVARRKEIIIGILAYLSLTWEGNIVVFATILGALGGWAIIKSIVRT